MGDNYTKLYNDQVTLNREYSTYTSAYLTYMSCQNDSSQSECNKHTTPPDSTNLAAAIKSVSDDLSKLPKNDNVTQANMDKSYADLVKMRSGLDLKLQQLYNSQNSSPNSYQPQIDSTVYSGVLWTVLVTTLVYYVFTKL